MKLEEAKIGMRVGFCRTAAKKRSYSRYDILFFETHCFPAKIDRIPFNSPFITVLGADGLLSSFHHSILVE